MMLLRLVSSCHFCWAVVSVVNFDFSMDKLNLAVRQYTIVEGEKEIVEVLLRLVNGPFVYQMFPEIR